MNYFKSKLMILFVAALCSLPALAFDYDAELQKDCAATWGKVFGPNARTGASWNSEYGWAHDTQCSAIIQNLDATANRPERSRDGKVAAH